jgi:hypothetical protein
MSVLVFDTAPRKSAPRSDAAAAHIDMIKRFAKLAIGAGLMAFTVAAVVGAKLAIFMPRVLH